VTLREAASRKVTLNEYLVQFVMVNNRRFETGAAGEIRLISLPALTKQKTDLSRIKLQKD